MGPLEVYLTIGNKVLDLQFLGNNITASMTELGLEYDSSWPTFSYVDPGMWPYSLDYPSIQDCAIGPCPSDSAPGIWEQPMIDMLDNSGVPCSMADGCVDVLVFFFLILTSANIANLL